MGKTHAFGLFLMMLGIIGEYICRVFEQINGAPVSVVETGRL